jgi:branched-chain amino acid transport system ATP-binding protein
MSALELTNVSVRYGNIVGTQGVSFKLNAGETMALVGSNGAGKSSTLKAILGLVDYPDGDVLIDGASLRGFVPGTS